MFGFGKQIGHYKNPEVISYYSSRYDKFIVVEEGYPSDGATGAFDVCLTAWMVHDKLCDTGVFSDGTLCTNWQASMIISDILEQICDRHFRKYTWLWATFLLGGGKCRENGMFSLQKGTSSSS